MDITIDASELDQLARDLAKEDRTASVPRINKAIGAGIDWLYARAEADAPRDTGTLAASIAKDDGRSGFSRRVYVTGKGLAPKDSGARHGYFQEFGTSRMRPQPFLLIHAERAADVAVTALVFLCDDILEK